MIGGIGMPELLIILAIVVVLFGAQKLPQIGRGLGEGIQNFRKATRELSGNVEEEALQKEEEKEEEKATNP